MVVGEVVGEVVGMVVGEEEQEGKEGITSRVVPDRRIT